MWAYGNSRGVDHEPAVEVETSIIVSISDPVSYYKLALFWSVFWHDSVRKVLDVAIIKYLVASIREGDLSRLPVRGPTGTPQHPFKLLVQISSLPPISPRSNALAYHLAYNPN